MPTRPLGLTCSTEYASDQLNEHRQPDNEMSGNSRMEIVLSIPEWPKARLPPVI
jgi:hypothetical protein